MNHRPHDPNSPDDSDGPDRLDGLARRAVAAPLTRIPDLAALRQRVAQRRRRRAIARIAAVPALAVIAAAGWAITAQDNTTQLTTAAETDTTDDTGSDEPDGDTAAGETGADPAEAVTVDSPGEFVWPAPPRGFETLDELIEQFVVEVPGWQPEIVFVDASDEPIAQAFILVHGDRDHDGSFEHRHEHYAVAMPSSEGWGLIQVGGGGVDVSENAEGVAVVRFSLPDGTAVSTVEVRYASGDITSHTTPDPELLLPPGRSAESVVSVLVTHVAANGTVITVSGSQFALDVEGILAEVPTHEGRAVPNLIGLTVTESQKVIREIQAATGLAIRIDRIVFDETADAPPGTIVATEPSAGDYFGLDSRSDMSLTIAASEPSQSPEDAARDQIVLELAALPYGVRVQQEHEDFGPTRVETDEGIWIISRMQSDAAWALTHKTGCNLAGPNNSDDVYGRDIICLMDYSEILLLDPGSGDILRAYPFPGVFPRQLHATDDAVYCISQGDGGYPDSMLCRIDLATGEPTVRIFPSDLDYDPAHYAPENYWTPRGWTIDEPVDVVLWSNLEVSGDGITISGHSGSATVDPITLELKSIDLADG